MPLSTPFSGEQLVAHHYMPEDRRTVGLQVHVLVHAVHLRAAGAMDDVGFRRQRRFEFVELEHCSTRAE